MPRIDELDGTVYSSSYTVVDVRSPAEFSRGHIPNAVSMPLFSDEERATVGTTYVQTGRDQAIDQGMEFVAPRLNSYLEQVHNMPALPLRMYCWRGGMRSASLAWFLSETGSKVETIVGGYKAYRRHVLADLEKPWKFVVIGGYTGSGKTEVLHWLRNHGEQVIDLEDLCSHRGSAFGALMMAAQPKSEHAMNLVHKAISTCDPSRTIYIEDESQHIGSVWLHEPLFKHMRNCPLIIVDIPRQERVKHLTAVYGNADADLLRESFIKIGKPLGGQRLAVALDALGHGDIGGAADIALDHYDKAYAYGLTKRNAPAITTLHCARVDAAEIATQVLMCSAQL